MTDIRLREASDYAVLGVGPHHFYYGYELDFAGDLTWGFEYSHDSTSRYRITADAMASYPRCPDQFACQARLLFGIGLALAAGVFVVTEGF